jgi:type IV secretory pathway VirB3-like protein
MEVLIFIAVSLLIILFIIALVHKFVFYAQLEDSVKVDELICESMREQGRSENEIMQCADHNHFYYYPPNK